MRAPTASPMMPGANRPHLRRGRGERHVRRGRGRGYSLESKAAAHHSGYHEIALRSVYLRLSCYAHFFPTEVIQSLQLCPRRVVRLIAPPTEVVCSGTCDEGRGEAAHVVGSRPEAATNRDREVINESWVVAGEPGYRV